MEPNEAIIILTHCDNSNKLEILEECIELCKKQNRKIIVSTNYKLPERIYEKADYIVYEKENRLIYHYENIPSGYSFFVNFPTYWHIQRVEYDISYAALQLIKNGLNLSIQKGFVNSHFVNYDYLIREENFFEKHAALLGLEYDAISYYFCDDYFFNSGMFSTVNKTFSKILESVNSVYDYGRLHDEAISYNKINGVLEGVLDYLFYKNDTNYLKVKEEELDAKINDFNKLCIFSRNHFIENTDIEIYKSTDGTECYLTFINHGNEKIDIIEIGAEDRTMLFKFREAVEYVNNITGMPLFMLKLPYGLNGKKIIVNVPEIGSKIIETNYSIALCEIRDERIIFTDENLHIIDKKISIYKDMSQKQPDKNNVRSFREISDSVDCDKTVYHKYDKIYPDFLEGFRSEKFNMLEIGIDAGKSLKIWQEYFPNANIYGMDIGVSLKYDRGEVFLGDQSKNEDLVRVSSNIGKCKFILDDGSHVADHQLKTFYYLFENLLEYGGVYIIEDIECSYWKPKSVLYGNETGYLNIVDYFTKLNHDVNSHYNLGENNLHIKSITFAPNCIIIKKKTKFDIVDDDREYRFSNCIKQEQYLC